MTADFTLDDHVATAAALGRWQGRPPLTRPWSSRGFLRGYSTSRPWDLTVVDDDAAWEQPLLRATWPEGLRDGWARLLRARGEEVAARGLVALPTWHTSNQVFAVPPPIRAEREQDLVDTYVEARRLAG